MDQGTQEGFKITSVRSERTLFNFKNLFFSPLSCLHFSKNEALGAGKSSLHPKDSATCDNDCEARLSLLARMTRE